MIKTAFMIIVAVAIVCIIIYCIYSIIAKARRLLDEDIIADEERLRALRYAESDVETAIERYERVTKLHDEMVERKKLDS